ncbi:MAG: efflux RND transporter periplasmic adaptor subunit, partial [Lysobacterales bacterium]
MKRFVIVVAALAGLGALLAGAYTLGTRRSAPAAASTTQQPPRRAVLYWYDPMRPDQHFDKPGKSPFMDMRLVPRFADETVAAGAVRVDPTVVQNLGVRTRVVQLGRLEATRRVTGTVSWDLRDSHVVNARVDAVVDRLYARTPFTTVRKGDPLLTLLAPQWSAAAAEYFALADAQSADGRALRDAARSRLRALGMNTADIASLRPGDARVAVRAPADGVVVELSVREGERVLAGAPMLRVNGLDHVWLEAAVPQAEVAGIAAGTPVTASIDALAGETFAGRVEVLLPDVDVATRTQRARIVLDNPRHRLVPGMFAQVNIVAAAGGEHPLVPD